MHERFDRAVHMALGISVCNFLSPLFWTPKGWCFIVVVLFCFTWEIFVE